MAFIAEVIVLDSIGFMTCLSVVGEGGVAVYLMFVHCI